jgi:hypothetical protein
MIYLQRELDCIGDALRRTPICDPRYVELYAAQQALSWVSDPLGFKPWLHLFGVEPATRLAFSGA